jgi:hypothetical protein
MRNTIWFALFCQTALQSLNAVLHFVWIGVWFSQLAWVALMLSL